MLVQAIRSLTNGPTGDVSDFQRAKDWLLGAMGGGKTRAGVIVNDTTSLSSTAVVCAARSIMEAVATLPINVYRQVDPRTVEIADHPLNVLLKRAPNPEMTAFEMLEWLVFSDLFYGNFYAQIERDNTGRVVYIWPLPAFRVKVKRDIETDAILYQYTPEKGARETFAASEIWHVPGFYPGGLVGLAARDMGREAIGATVAADRMAAEYYETGITAKGVVKHPLELSEEAHKKLQAALTAAFSAGQGAAVLDEGMDWASIGVSAKDAQMVEARTFQIGEIARIFNVPPHRLFELGHATFSNIEHQSLEWVQYTIAPWCKRIEQRIEKDLLRGDMRFFARFNMDALLRGDTQTRYASLVQGVQWGILTRNEARSILDMNPIEGGDVVLPPPNANATETVQSDPAPRAARALPKPQDVHVRARVAQRTVLRDAYRDTIQQAAERLLRAEKREIRKFMKAAKLEAERGTPDFMAAVQEYFKEGGEFSAAIDAILAPVMETYGRALAAAVAQEVGRVPDDPAEIDAFIANYLAALKARVAIAHEQGIRFAIQDGDAQEVPIPTAQSIEDYLADLEESEAESLALAESTRMDGAIAVMMLGLLRVDKVVWVANSDACPICQEMDGRVVEIGKTFADPGTEIETLTVTSIIKHPPLHKGCECTVTDA